MSKLSGRFSQSPSEHRRYTMDMTLDLSQGETMLSLPVGTITSPTGAPDTLVVDNVIITTDGLHAVFYVSGGTDGHSYEIQFLPPTSIGQTLEVVVQIDIAKKV